MVVGSAKQKAGGSSYGKERAIEWRVRILSIYMDFKGVYLIKKRVI